MIMMLFPVTSNDRRLLNGGRLIAGQIVYGLTLDDLRRAQEHVHLVAVGQIADLAQCFQWGVLFDLERKSGKISLGFVRGSY